MPVELVIDEVSQELPAVAQYIAAAGLLLDDSLVLAEEPRPVFYVTFYNVEGWPFYAEINCRDYPMHPPTVEFLDETRTRRGATSAYPAGFHTMPCVCARYNRKAYQERGGPHGDWRLIDWQLPTSNGVAIKSLALIVSDLHSKIGASRGTM